MYISYCTSMANLLALLYNTFALEYHAYKDVTSTTGLTN